MTLLAREDTFSVHATIDGIDFGEWIAQTGGAGDSEESKLKLGGMGPQVSLGGSQTIENVTLRKEFDLDGIGNRVAWFYARRGRARVHITRQPLDHDGNVYGQGWAFTGTLKQVTPPDYDAESNDAALIELEISTDGVVA